MVDAPLPKRLDDRKLRYAFLDLNSYFASVEQQEDPKLRGRPVAVAPLYAETTFVIAASYEAKAYGVRTGTMVREARIMCPEIEIVAARPPAYVAYHERVKRAAEAVLPIDEVCSIDEMRFRLLGEEREPARARQLGQRLKDAIRDQVGEYMKCSVGIAPNAFLSKVATELQKPDGLVVIQSHELPEALLNLELMDFPGINRRMNVRLNAAGIFDTAQLCRADRDHMVRAFGSIVGERWWSMLRGYDVRTEVRTRQTLGHSHVLSPERRTDQGCREVLMRLIQKASARLRAERLWAGGMAVSVGAFTKSWQAKARLPDTQDTVSMNEAFFRLWEGRDFVRPRSVSVTFYDLQEADQVTPSLFEDSVQRTELNSAIDEVNQKFGKNSVFLAGLENAKSSADEKIAFNKTWLFQEGKGDNEWVDTFRGIRSSE